MRQTSLIAAHLAAHIHKHTIFAPGFGYVAASGTVIQEASRYHDQSPAALQLSLDLFIRFDPNLGQLRRDQLVQEPGPKLLSKAEQLRSALAAVLCCLLHDGNHVEQRSVHQRRGVPKLLLKSTGTVSIRNKAAGFLPPGQAILLQAFSGHEGAGFLGRAHDHQSPYYYIQLSAYYSFDGYWFAGKVNSLEAAMMH
jgi:hypothetical protein